MSFSVCFFLQSLMSLNFCVFRLTFKQPLQYIGSTEDLSVFFFKSVDAVDATKLYIGLDALLHYFGTSSLPANPSLAFSQ